MENNNEDQEVFKTQASAKEESLSPVFLIVLLLLILFVIFLPNIKALADKVLKADDEQLEETIPPVPDDKEQKGEKEKPKAKSYVIAFAKESEITFEDDLLLETIKTLSPHKENLEIVFSENILSFSLEDNKAVFTLEGNTFKADIALDATNKVFYDESYETLVSALATLHGQRAEDVSYTIEHNAFAKYSEHQGFSIDYKADRAIYMAKTNVLFNLMDNTKAVIEIDELGLKELLISEDLTKEKGDLLIEVSANEQLVITIGQKNQIDDISFKTLYNIVEFVYNNEEVKELEAVITDLKIDTEKDIYKYEYMPEKVPDKFINYNVISLSIDKKII